MKEFRKMLSGLWQRAIAVQLVGVLAALLMLLAGWYTALTIACIDQRFAQPYAILGTLLLCLADLLLRSPIRAGQFAFYRDVARGGSVPAFTVLRGFGGSLYRKAVCLRIQLWKKRIWYTGIALLPPSILLGYGNRLQDRMPQNITYLLLCVTVAVFLVAGLCVVEWCLLRYMPAWQLLPECKTVKDALKQAREITRKQLGEWTEWYLRSFGWRLLVLPYVYTGPLLAVERAEKIERAHILKRIAQTDTGVEIEHAPEKPIRIWEEKDMNNQQNNNQNRNQNNQNQNNNNNQNQNRNQNNNQNRNQNNNQNRNQF